MLGIELAPIRVNAVCIGIVKTNLLRHLPEVEGGKSAQVSKLVK